MKNATIATSRTRASSDHLLTYRPLHDEWGDANALRALRALQTGTTGRRAEAVFARRAEQAVEQAVEPTAAPARRPSSSGRHRSRSRVPAHHVGLFGLLHGA